MITAAIVTLLILGNLLMLLAGIGLVRMPDVFIRMHASTKGASLGVSLLMIAAALYFQELGISTKAIITITFVFLTAPVGAHMLGRAAYCRKTPLWEHTVIDEAKGRLGLPDVPSEPPRES